MFLKEVSRKPWYRTTVIVLFTAIVLCLVLWFRQGAAPLPVIKKAPEFSLQDLKGQPLKLSESAGKVRLLEFFFANCPDICPATTSNMVLMQNNLKEKGKFGNKVEFLSITFDPDRDTPEVLEKYGSLLGIDQAAGWHLLRGSEKEVLQTATDYGIMAVKQKDGQFAHSIKSLFLIDQDGFIRKVFDMGESMDNEAIEKSINQLL
ncbi:SCO family protein [Paenibacillus sp. SYP-B3998]|uniref:SCO family protein n=1 Tax=Paenibacillus sp. SYP-B3998 TaxID=2678564 RepID=A0A6G3ZTY5_9BACL|nr:SCO family protein [Paenibacillus sp. SYP-B3998]NEW05676.1 SCO family protein [Paenibacillus sp. SYP-B3998]